MSEMNEIWSKLNASLTAEQREVFNEWRKEIQRNADIVTICVRQRPGALGVQIAAAERLKFDINLIPAFRSFKADLTAAEQERLLDAAVRQGRERMHARNLKEIALVNAVDKRLEARSVGEGENLIEDMTKFLPDDKLEYILDRLEAGAYK